MRRLIGNELALVELLSLKPIRDLPPMHEEIAKRLRQRGVLDRREEHWFPTAAGLRRAGRTVH